MRVTPTMTMIMMMVMTMMGSMLASGQARTERTEERRQDVLGHAQARGEGREGGTGCGWRGAAVVGVSFVATADVGRAGGVRRERKPTHALFPLFRAEAAAAPLPESERRNSRAVKCPPRPSPSPSLAAAVCVRRRGGALHRDGVS